MFAADLITNPNSWELENPDSANTLNELVAELISRAEKEKTLFEGDSDGDALALMLMRAAIRAGAPAATVRYSQRVPESSAVRATPEYNWLVGAARFQQNEYEPAEKLFLNALQSNTADHRHKQFALNALIGVYAKLNRPVDQLWATFQSALLATEQDWEHYYEVSAAGLDGWSNLDIAHLLDVQLTDPELRQYLDRFPDAGKRLPTIYPRERTPAELVRYALAVRHARREEYSEAASITKGYSHPRALDACEPQRDWPKLHGTPRVQSSVNCKHNTTMPSFSPTTRMEFSSTIPSGTAFKRGPFSSNRDK